MTWTAECWQGGRRERLSRVGLERVGGEQLEAASIENMMRRFATKGSQDGRKHFSW